MFVLSEEQDQNHHLNFINNKSEFIEEQLLKHTGDKFRNCLNELRTSGITRISGLFSEEEITQMQSDVQGWCKDKNWNVDREIYFDGNSEENYLGTSKSLSKAVSNSAILGVLTGYFKTHLR